MRTDVYSLRSFLLLIPAALLLTSCGVVQRTAGPSDVKPKPALSDEDMTSYKAGDVIQEGLASWYGPKFHGKLTANGEIYEMDDLTAAHRTLPFNTRIRVTNQSNGKSVDVRVNDRGPYVGDRIIDLSRGAAQAIDMIDDGVGHVRLQLLQTGDREVNSANASSRENFTVQLASFDSHNQALLEAEQIVGAEVVPVQIARETIYRVYYGNFPHPDEAEKQLRQLQKQGYDGFVKQREN